MPIQKFIMTRDINGFNGFGLPFSNNKYQAVLEGNSEDLLDNIMRLISSEETSNIRIRTDEEYNDTIDCSRNSFLISNEN